MHPIDPALPDAPAPGTPARGPHPAAAPLEVLSFRIGEQDYSFDIMDVREIRGWSRPTPLPHAPDHLRGVINLRGAVLPIVDLASRLGIARAARTDRDVIIVVQRGKRTLGMQVSAVSDILTLGPDEMQPAPRLSDSQAHGFLSGIAIHEGRMIRVIDLDTLIPQIGAA